MGVTSLVLGLLILATIIGNVFVIAAILLERNLQNVANYLIVSLAVADLMVACLVMPLGAVYQISKGWILGPELCDMWTSSDVLCCTASILHLVAIAVDRYWAVTNVDYIHTRNSSRIGIMIIVVWAVALIVSLAPQFGWKDPEYLDRINVQQRCLVSQDVAYQIFATCSTFYVPLLVILVLYWKIFQTARKRIHRRRQQRPLTGRFLSKRRFRRLRASKKSSAAEALVSSLALVEGQSTASAEAISDDATSGVPATTSSPTDVCGDSTATLDGSAPALETTAFTISKAVEQRSAAAANVGAAVGAGLAAASNSVSPEKSSTPTTTNNGSASHQSHMSDMSRSEILHKDGGPGMAVGGGLLGRTAAAMVGAVAASGAVLPAASGAAATSTPRAKKESLEAKRERKAAKTLAIITGAFVVCWLPFFIMALLMPLCDTCVISEDLSSFFLWLGYFNSTLNPVIYTIFSPEFRQAFKRILCGAGSRRSKFRAGKLR
ncbi:5-hydroxytryptamine receptor [Schistocerca gregaria]|uniref:5-hydroxytryptamine receptor n=1 Tax=Schistocerca gregaria TaxID=7010 RepID=UPI00211E40DD|nr:5-hydroxytryptamine receptor [Schistocerca gregaria]